MKREMGIERKGIERKGTKEKRYRHSASAAVSLVCVRTVSIIISGQSFLRLAIRINIRRARNTAIMRTGIQ
jgi:hypothetical protein